MQTVCEILDNLAVDTEAFPSGDNLGRYNPKKVYQGERPSAVKWNRRLPPRKNAKDSNPSSVGHFDGTLQVIDILPVTAPDLMRPCVFLCHSKSNDPLGCSGL